MTHLIRILTAVSLWLAMSASPASAQEWSRPPAEPIVMQEAPAPPVAWTRESGTRLTVHGPPGRQDLLLRLARHGAEALPQLADRLGVPVGPRIHVYVSPTQEHFRDFQPGNAPTWADATAYPGRGAVFLRDPRIRIATDEPLEQVLEHELVHILLGRAFAPQHPPAWLQEGVAQVLAKQAGPDTARVLATATLQGSIMSLDSLSRWFPSHPHRAHVAYAQSADFVQYLEVEYGADVLPTLVQSVLKGRSLSGAVREATGSTLGRVEADWRSRWTVSRGVAAGLMANLGEIAFGATALLLIGAGVMRRRRFHARLEEMAREEAMVDALVEEMRARRGYP